MFANNRFKWLVLLVIFVALFAVGGIALAQAPEPNPLKPVEVGGNPIFAPVPGADITQNGAAAKIHGDPGAGRTLFALNCTTCHGDRGTYGIVNPGSDDGSVPVLNPASEFLEDSQGDPEKFAAAIDLFIQHGSRPAGDDPLYSMVGWGDQKLMTQQQIADVEAYVMSMNGVYWNDRYYPPAEVQMQAVSTKDTITYTITIINHAGSGLQNWTLLDTLPDGLVPYKAGLLSLDNPSGDGAGQINGTTVNWSNQDTSIPVGGKLGPFTIVARQTDPRQPTPPNVAQFIFEFMTHDGTTYSGATTVSNPVAPATPTPKPTATATPTAKPTSAPTSAAATAVPTSAPTATPVAAVPTPTNYTAQIVEPNPGALSWMFDPNSITIKVGDKITWTNSGSLPHSVISDDGLFDSGLLNLNDTWSFTFTKTGTYTYHCTPHPWMKATVIVQ